MESTAVEQLNKIERIKERRKQQAHDRAVAAAKILSGLPKSIDPVTLASFRLQEIKSIEGELTDAVKDRKRRLFQTLPRHLRRRTASYNPKRVPCPYRGQATAELLRKGEFATRVPKKSHTGPKNKQRWQLKREYMSRQIGGKPRWLETHIWHAKRMHMCAKWGFKIAQKANQKVFKFNFRNGKSACCLYDYSYLRVYSIDTDLIQSFAIKHCQLNSDFNLDVDSVSGLLYHDARSLQGLISTVTILKFRQSWLVVIHPSSIEEFVDICSEFSIKGPLKLNIFCLFGNKTVDTLESLKAKYSDELFSYKLSSPFHLTSQYCWVVVEQEKGREYWRRFIYSNCKPYSLEDLYNFYFENEALMFPFHYHQSAGFGVEMKEVADALESEWKAKPLSKRINYEALGIESPFLLPHLDEPLEMVFIEPVNAGVPGYNARIFLDLESDITVGYVVYGNFSLRTGKGKAVALLKQGIGPLFWCRNISSPKEHSFQCQRMNST